MASPNGQVSHTPLRRLQQEVDTDSPSSVATDSPSRQLLLELSMQTVEYTHQLCSKLDRQAWEREQSYLEALGAASAEHERIRRSAQRAQELVELETEKRRRDEETAEIRALDRERQEKVEQEIAQRREALEESKRLAEKEKIAAETKTAAEEAEKHRHAQKANEDEEAAKQASAQRDLREREAQSKNEISPWPASQPNGTPSREKPLSTQPIASQPAASSSVGPAPSLLPDQAGREAEHERYLVLHKALKKHRKDFVALSASDQTVKNRTGEMRREIRKSVGQLTADIQARRIPLTKVRTVMKEALQMQNPSVDIAPFIISQPLPPVDASQRQVSGLLIYLLNIFSKSVIAQFTDETGADSRTADPIGIMAISIFAHNEFRWQGISLIDMLIAKFHVHCPVLFGIYGSETTERGRMRLGWRRDPDTGTWVSEQRHSERMTGLGSGFGALSLRNFQNSASRNPYPPSNFWRAIAGIVNTPAQQITQTHCIVLKAMIEHHVIRFVSFYGSAAIAVVKKAVAELPKQAPPSTAANVLATLASTLRRDLNFTI